MSEIACRCILTGRMCELHQAAPDLLAALEAAAPMLFLAAQRAEKVQAIDERDWHLRTYEAARAAISKARGAPVSV